MSTILTKTFIRPQMIRTKYNVIKITGVPLFIVCQALHSYGDSSYTWDLFRKENKRKEKYGNA